jgi:Family of unknown function (DUF6527)
MTRRTALAHQFVEYMPDQLKDGVLYVSILFATVAHKCCCGCGQEVVTPLSPTDWKLIFDGRSISLDPSIGNWSLPCKSHYWIRSGRVRWAGMWTHEQIENGRAADRTAKEKYFNADAAAPTEPKAKRPIWSRLKWW